MRGHKQRKDAAYFVRSFHIRHLSDEKYKYSALDSGKGEKAPSGALTRLERTEIFDGYLRLTFQLRASFCLRLHFPLDMVSDVTARRVQFTQPCSVTIVTYLRVPVLTLAKESDARWSM